MHALLHKGMHVWDHEALEHWKDQIWCGQSILLLSQYHTHQSHIFWTPLWLSYRYIYDVAEWVLKAINFVEDTIIIIVYYACVCAQSCMLLYNPWPTVLHAKLILQCHDHVYIYTNHWYFQLLWDFRITIINPRQNFILEKVWKWSMTYNNILFIVVQSFIYIHVRTKVAAQCSNLNMQNIFVCDTKLWLLSLQHSDILSSNIASSKS